MFFAYNNGIAATATEIKTELGDDGLKIVQIKDLQIINGGQTTASIANAVLQDKKDVSNIFVPMKLSVVDHEKATEMIPTISRFKIFLNMQIVKIKLMKQISFQIIHTI